MSKFKRHFLLAIVVALGAAGTVPLAQFASPADRPSAVAQARPAGTQAASRITAPKEEWGQNIGDDYFLANYQQLLAYWRKLEKESPRIKIEEIGQTAMKKPHLMAIITSPENHKQLAKYKDISRRLSLAEGLTDDQARALAREGKAVVWIDGGLHASESLGAQQLLELV
jgi:Zinc carboxypeptidase